MIFGSLRLYGRILQDFREGGGIPPDLRHFLQGGGSGDPPVWLRELGDNPKDREDPLRITEIVWPSGNETEAVHGKEMVIPAYGQINGKCGDRECGCICPLTQEHHQLIYCNLDDTGTMSSGGTAAVTTDVTMVVGIGKDRTGARKGEDGGALNFVIIIEHLVENIYQP